MPANDDYSAWRYDEFTQVGTDYGQSEEANAYDDNHARIRDVDAENQAILERLNLPADATLIDYGCGPGAFVLHAAPVCKRVYAVDVSEEMLKIGTQKAVAAGIDNLSFVHAGYLSYDHQDDPADAITSSFSFHHLPDFWKFEALTRMRAQLKEGGLFYLHDVVIEQENRISNMNALLDSLGKNGGEKMISETQDHYRDEYSTFDWIIDGMLDRSGFEIAERSFDQGVVATYLAKAV
jgi:putative AdoMet-dependent methyltransferase